MSGPHFNLADLFEIVADTVPAMLTVAGAVAVTPPANDVLSPDPSPKVTVPLLPNTVVPAIVFVPPVKDTW